MTAWNGEKASTKIDDWFSVPEPIIRYGHPEDIEQLHPDLRPYVQKGPLGLGLRHPLVYQTFGIVWMQANAMYEHKVEMLAEAHKTGEWYRYVFLHERPYRLTTLDDLWKEGVLTRQAFRELLADVWTDAEYPSQHGKRLLVRMFRLAGFITDDPNEDLDTAAEPPSWRVEDRLPPIVTVYRGQPIGERPGLSWTTDKDMGAWFARRYRDEGKAMLLSGTVAREKVFAYFEGRGEHEVVVDPRYIKDLQMIDLPPAKTRSEFQPGFPKVKVSTPDAVVDGLNVSVTS